MNKTKRLLIGTSRYLLLFDIESGERQIISEKYGLYYGITWDHKYIYVAARWYPNFMPTSHFERPRLLVFDDRLSMVDCQKFDVPAGGLHQIFYYDDALYCSCSRDDSYIVCNTKTPKNWNIWYPSLDSKDHKKDTHHFNSIWIHNNRMYLVGHNNGPSDVWEYSYPDKQLVSKHRIGSRIHNVWLEDSQIAVCNSEAGQLETVNGKILCKTNEFPRGLVLGPDINVVGVSAIANRSNRKMTPGTIKIYSKNWNHLEDFSLGDCGQVCEIRSLDAQDFAHNEIPPPIG